MTREDERRRETRASNGEFVCTNTAFFLWTTGAGDKLISGGGIEGAAGMLGM